MEEGVLLTAALSAGFLSAALLGSGVFVELERVRSSIDIQTVTPSWKDEGTGIRRSRFLREAHAVAAYYVRNGIGAFKGLANRMMRMKSIRGLFQDMEKLAQRSGWDASAESLASVFFFLAFVGSAAVLVLFGSGVTCVLTPLCMLVGTAFGVSQRKAKEHEALRDQVPEALRCMEASLHAGESLPQAFSEVASELPSPTKELFARVSQDLELGYSMNEALTRFHKRAELPELAFVAMALDVQYACGGSATPILRSAERSVSQGVNLKRSLRVQTAQARLSAQIVCVMPFALLFVLSAVSPGFLDPFFNSTEGVVLFAAALGMQALGVVLVKRGLDVGL